MSDKYTERARKCFESTIHSSKRVEKIEAIACALEQAALEARMIGFARALDLIRLYRGTGELTARCEAELEQLRARLAELRPEQEGKDAKVL